MMPEPEANNTTEPAQKPAASRRDFLSLAWKSALGLSGILGATGMLEYFSYLPETSTPTVFDLGPADQLPTGSVMVIQQAQAAIVPTTEGLLALSLACPHLGCIVETKEESFDCPCHGSRFALNGNLIKGPASESLRKLLLTTDENGHLILDTTESPV